VSNLERHDAIAATFLYEVPVSAIAALGANRTTGCSSRVGSGPVKLSVGLPTHRVDRASELVTADAVAQLASAAEASGFDAVFVTDHPFPADGWLAHGGHHALDPLVALAFAAAATRTLRLHTNLFVAAYRNPFVSAKAVATLDALSGGRVILGVGAGYLEGEFDALGARFDERNDATDEAIVAMRAAWSGESVTMKGRDFDARGNTMLPRPAQRPGPPIWIGGNSKRAIRRAVELGDGWSPMPSPARASARLRTPGLETLDDLRERLRYAAEHAAAVGRDAPLDVAFMPVGLDMFTNARLDASRTVDGIAALADAGVTYAIVTLPGETRAEVVANLQQFGAEVIPRVAGL
jgi:probable F420-dependent oxidoreductase